MLDEMRAFVVLVESGSLQGAAERLYLTPSAVTRQIQRLEAALKTPLLDRRVKPARITREGRAVLDRGRQMLRIMEDLKASGAKDAEPSGIFRFGLSHMLAQPRLECGANEAPGRVEYPASVERVIFRRAAARWARLLFSRLDQYQAFRGQNAAGHIAGDRVVRREERQCHIELAAAHLLDQLLPQVGAQHRLKLGEATR